MPFCIGMCVHRARASARACVASLGFGRALVPPRVAAREMRALSPRGRRVRRAARWCSRSCLCLAHGRGSDAGCAVDPDNFDIGAYARRTRGDAAEHHRVRRGGRGRVAGGVPPAERQAIRGARPEGRHAVDDGPERLGQVDDRARARGGARADLRQARPDARRRQRAHGPQPRPRL